MGLLKYLKSLRRDRGGATAVVFAAAAVPLFSLIALAIDYSGIVAARAKLNLAADSGVLMATQDTAYQFNQGILPASTSEQPINAGKARFGLQAAGVAGATVNRMDLAVTQNGSVFTGKITYQASYRPMFAGLLGFDSIPVSGTASAVAVTKVYVDFQVIIDGSDSMTIASSADQATYLETVLEQGWGTYNNYVEDLPPNPNPTGTYASVKTIGCYFACHFGDHYSDPPYTNQVDFYTTAVAAGVVMRFTQVKTAAVQLAQLVKDRNLSQFRMGVYLAALHQCVSWNGNSCGFSDILENVPLTGNISSVIDAIPSIDVANRDYTNGAYNGGTDLNGSLEDFRRTYLGTPGDGSTPSAPKKFVLLFTDGANDVPGSDSWNNAPHAYPVMDQTKCNALKDSGVTLVIMQTLAPTFSWAGSARINGNQNVINDHHGPDYPTLTANLQACASPNMFFMVDQQQDFNNAMTNALNVALTEPTHFTQ